MSFKLTQVLQSFLFRSSCMLFLFLCSSEPLFAQLGPDAFQKKWSQINTPLVRIIFPAGMDSIAKVVVQNIYNLENTHSENFTQKQKKVDIVLQNETVVSNGYVDLAPFKSEFYLIPPQNSLELGSMPWLDLLTIHEYRHVQQFNNFDVGISKLMHTLFGQEAQSFMHSMAVPNWFFEGDAVYNETRFSKQGRGRLPLFFNGYRSLWQEGKNYNWMKLRNGSLKDFVPNHYPLGYMIVAYGREKYGPDFWKNVTNDAAHFKGVFYPFQNAVEKNTGVKFNTFVADAFSFYQKKFNINTKADSQKEEYRNENMPTFTENGDIIFVQSSFKSTPSFVLKNNEGEKTIRKMDNALDNYFSYRNGKIVYASYRPHIRRSNISYNEIQILDVHNGNQYTLTNNTKYFSPDINFDGTEVVAVNVMENGYSSLDILDISSGDLLNRIDAKDGWVFTYPKYISNEEIISPVKNKEGKMAIISIDKSSKKIDTLLPFSNHAIGYPTVSGDTLFFTMAYQGNDELMALSLATKELNMLHIKNQKAIGSYHASIKGNDLIFYGFTADGNRIIHNNLDEIVFSKIKIEELQKPLSNLGIDALSQNILDKKTSDSFPVTAYHKGAHFINFHSLRASIDDPVYKVSWLSNDVMNTTATEIFFNYNRSDRSKILGGSISYGGLFPVITAGINYAFDRKTNFKGVPVYFSQMQPYVGISVPMNLSKGRSLMGLSFGSNWVYNKTNFQGFYKDSLRSDPFSYLSNFISFSHQVLKAQQEIYPKWGQSIAFTYKLSMSVYEGYQFGVSSNLYFPALMKTHSLVVSGAYLKNDKNGNIQFSSDFPFSRGYSGFNFMEMNKWGVNYHLPLLYSDAGFGNIFYLLRVRANMYYDDTRATDLYTNGATFKGKFRSTGAEIYFDSKWWNQFDVSFGIRYAHLLDDDLMGGSGQNRWELLLPVNIFNR